MNEHTDAAPSNLRLREQMAGQYLWFVNGEGNGK